MRNPTYDVAIIGLGPAGATVARLLDKTFQVIAIDKKTDSDRSFKKSCGGLLATDAQKMLSKFNFSLPKELLVDPQIFAVKTIDARQNLSRYYQRFYINLNRHKFDMWLVSLIPKHVDVKIDASCIKIEQAAELYKITYMQNGKTETITARHVIGADGSNSMVRKTLFQRRKIPQYVAIQQWFIEKHQDRFYSCIFDDRITNSYCWGVSKDGHFILGGAFPPDNSKQRFERLKETVKNQGFCLGEEVRTEACLISMPRGMRDFCVARGRSFLVGEAAGLVSPTSLEGISYALDSACKLAAVLNSRCGNPAWTFWIKSIPIRIKLLLKYLKAPFMYNPFLRRIVMKTGIRSIDVME